MKVLVIGDLHNEFYYLNQIIQVKEPDLVICCGDFGYWPKLEYLNPLTKIKPRNSKVLWIDGNHEDHWSLKEREQDEIVPNVIYMPRGSTYDLDDNRKILFMGGADSIDKNGRIIGVDWFPDEIIKERDLENLPDEKIDILISHTCPAELVEKLRVGYPEKGYEPSNFALSEIWGRYRPELLIFGHWHQFKKGTMDETKWFCLSYPSHGKWWMWLPEKGGEEKLR